MGNERGGSARERNWRDSEVKKRQRFFFFPVWFSIRGTRGDKTKRTVTQRNNPPSVPSCSCCSSLPLSVQFPQIPTEIESLFTGTVCWHHLLHTEYPAVSLCHPTTLLWQDGHAYTLTPTDVQRRDHVHTVQISFISRNYIGIINSKRLWLMHLKNTISVNP